MSTVSVPRQLDLTFLNMGCGSSKNTDATNMTHNDPSFLSVDVDESTIFLVVPTDEMLERVSSPMIMISDENALGPLDEPLTRTSVVQDDPESKSVTIKIVLSDSRLRSVVPCEETQTGAPKSIRIILVGSSERKLHAEESKSVYSLEENPSKVDKGLAAIEYPNYMSGPDQACNVGQSSRTLSDVNPSDYTAYTSDDKKCALQATAPHYQANNHHDTFVSVRDSHRNNQKRPFLYGPRLNFTQKIKMSENSQPGQEVPILLTPPSERRRKSDVIASDCALSSLSCQAVCSSNESTNAICPLPPSTKNYTRASILEVNTSQSSLSSSLTSSCVCCNDYVGMPCADGKKPTATAHNVCDSPASSFPKLKERAVLFLKGREETPMNIPDLKICSMKRTHADSGIPLLDEKAGWRIGEEQVLKGMRTRDNNLFVLSDLPSPSSQLRQGTRTIHKEKEVLCLPIRDNVTQYSTSRWRPSSVKFKDTENLPSQIAFGSRHRTFENVENSFRERPNILQNGVLTSASTSDLAVESRSNFRSGTMCKSFPGRQQIEQPSLSALDRRGRKTAVHRNVGVMPMKSRSDNQMLSSHSCCSLSSPRRVTNGTRTRDADELPQRNMMPTNFPQIRFTAGSPRTSETQGQSYVDAGKKKSRKHLQTITPMSDTTRQSKLTRFHYEDYDIPCNEVRTKHDLGKTFHSMETHKRAKGVVKFSDTSLHERSYSVPDMTFLQSDPYMLVRMRDEESAKGILVNKATGLKPSPRRPFELRSYERTKSGSNNDVNPYNYCAIQSGLRLDSPERRTKEVHKFGGISRYKPGNIRTPASKEIMADRPDYVLAGRSPTKGPESRTPAKDKHEANPSPIFQSDPSADPAPQRSLSLHRFQSTSKRHRHLTHANPDIRSSCLSPATNERQKVPRDFRNAQKLSASQSIVLSQLPDKHDKMSSPNREKGQHTNDYHTASKPSYPPELAPTHASEEPRQRHMSENGQRDGRRTTNYHDTYWRTSRRLSCTERPLSMIAPSQHSKHTAGYRTPPHATQNNLVGNSERQTDSGKTIYPLSHDGRAKDCDCIAPPRSLTMPPPLRLQGPHTCQHAVPTLSTQHSKDTSANPNYCHDRRDMLLPPGPDGWESRIEKSASLATKSLPHQSAVRSLDQFCKSTSNVTYEGARHSRCSTPKDRYVDAKEMQRQPSLRDSTILLEQHTRQGQSSRRDCTSSSEERLRISDTRRMDHPMDVKQRSSTLQKQPELPQPESGRRATSTQGSVASGNIETDLSKCQDPPARPPARQPSDSRYNTEKLSPETGPFSNRVGPPTQNLQTESLPPKQSTLRSSDVPRGSRDDYAEENVSSAKKQRVDIPKMQRQYFSAEQFSAMRTLYPDNDKRMPRQGTRCNSMPKPFRGSSGWNLSSGANELGTITEEGQMDTLVDSRRRTASALTLAHLRNAGSSQNTTPPENAAHPGVRKQRVRPVQSALRSLGLLCNSLSLPTEGEAKHANFSTTTSPDADKSRTQQMSVRSEKFYPTETSITECEERTAKLWYRCNSMPNSRDASDRSVAAREPKKVYEDKKRPFDRDASQRSMTHSAPRHIRNSEMSAGTTSTQSDCVRTDASVNTVVSRDFSGSLFASSLPGEESSATRGRMPWDSTSKGVGLSTTGLQMQPIPPKPSALRSLKVTPKPIFQRKDGSDSYTYSFDTNAPILPAFRNITSSFGNKSDVKVVDSRVRSLSITSLPSLRFASSGAPFSGIQMPSVTDPNQNSAENMYVGIYSDAWQKTILSPPAHFRYVNSGSSEMSTQTGVRQRCPTCPCAACAAAAHQEEKTKWSSSKDKAKKHVDFSPCISDISLSPSTASPIRDKCKPSPILKDKTGKHVKLIPRASTRSQSTTTSCACAMLSRGRLGRKDMNEMMTSTCPCCTTWLLPPPSPFQGSDAGAESDRNGDVRHAEPSRPGQPPVPHTTIVFDVETSMSSLSIPSNKAVVEDLYLSASHSPSLIRPPSPFQNMEAVSKASQTTSFLRRVRFWSAGHVQSSPGTPLCSPCHSNCTCRQGVHQTPASAQSWKTPAFPHSVPFSSSTPPPCLHRRPSRSNCDGKTTIKVTQDGQSGSRRSSEPFTLPRTSTPQQGAWSCLNHREQPEKHGVGEHGRPWRNAGRRTPAVTSTHQAPSPPVPSVQVTQSPFRRNKISSSSLARLIGSRPSARSSSLFASEFRSLSRSGSPNRNKTTKASGTNALPSHTRQTGVAPESQLTQALYPGCANLMLKDTHGHGDVVISYAPASVSSRFRQNTTSNPNATNKERIQMGNSTHAPSSPMPTPQQMPMTRWRTVSAPHADDDGGNRRMHLFPRVFTPPLGFRKSPSPMDSTLQSSFNSPYMPRVCPPPPQSPCPTAGTMGDRAGRHCPIVSYVCTEWNKLHMPQRIPSLPERLPTPPMRGQGKTGGSPAARSSPTWCRNTHNQSQQPPQHPAFSLAGSLPQSRETSNERRYMCSIQRLSRPTSPEQQFPGVRYHAMPNSRHVISVSRSEHPTIASRSTSHGSQRDRVLYTEHFMPKLPRLPRESLPPARWSRCGGSDESLSKSSVQPRGRDASPSRAMPTERQAKAVESDSSYVCRNKTLGDMYLSQPLQPSLLSARYMAHQRWLNKTRLMRTGRVDGDRCCHITDHSAQFSCRSQGVLPLSAVSVERQPRSPSRPRTREGSKTFYNQNNKYISIPSQHLSSTMNLEKNYLGQHSSQPESKYVGCKTDAERIKLHMLSSTATQTVPNDRQEMHYRPGQGSKTNEALKQKSSFRKKPLGSGGGLFRKTSSSSPIALRSSTGGVIKKAKCQRSRWRTAHQTKNANAVTNPLTSPCVQSTSTIKVDPVNQSMVNISTKPVSKNFPREKHLTHASSSTFSSDNNAGMPGWSRKKRAPINPPPSVRIRVEALRKIHASHQKCAADNEMTNTTSRISPQPRVESLSAFQNEPRPSKDRRRRRRTRTLTEKDRHFSHCTTSSRRASPTKPLEDDGSQLQNRSEQFQVHLRVPKLPHLTRSLSQTATGQILSMTREDHEKNVWYMQIALDNEVAQQIAPTVPMLQLSSQKKRAVKCGRKSQCNNKTIGAQTNHLDPLKPVRPTTTEPDVCSRG